MAGQLMPLRSEAAVGPRPLLLLALTLLAVALYAYLGDVRPPDIPLPTASSFGAVCRKESRRSVAGG